MNTRTTSPTTLTLQGIEVRVEFLERVFVGVSLSGKLGKEVGMNGEVEGTQRSESLRGGEITGHS